MTNLTATATDCTKINYYFSSNKGRYAWECACGELHRTAQSAVKCSKCRQYVADAPRTATHVIFGVTLSSEMVRYGHALMEEPVTVFSSEEEFRAAQKNAHANQRFA